MSNTVVHKFQSQYKPITSLALYPYGPVVIATAEDKTLRLYSLTSFKELHCMSLRENPLCVQILNEHSLCISSTNSLSVWTINHVNTPFCMVNAKTVTLRMIESIHKLRRVLVRSEDEIIRLISPVSAKVLCTCLPLFEMDAVQDVVHAISANKLFLLIETGEIWIIQANSNPCIVIDIWRGCNMGENISCICVAEGWARFQKSGKFVENAIEFGPIVPYSILMSGTGNGQILVYDLVGNVMHLGKVLQIITDADQNIVITFGEDNVISISRIDFTSSAFLKVKLEIILDQLPRSLCVSGNVICAAMEDFCVRMFSFDIVTSAFQELQSHNRGDDHIEQITSICAIKSLGLFLTASADTLIKVWDCQNTLVREIHLHSPITSVCGLNIQGDVLVDIESRIDVISHDVYLPHPYISRARTLKQTEICEDPIDFEDNFNFKQNFACSHVESDDHVGHSIDFSSLDGQKMRDQKTQFDMINFSGDKQTESRMKTRLRLSETGRQNKFKESESMYDSLMEKLSLILERRRRVMESAKRRMDSEKLAAEKQDAILHEEFEKIRKQYQFVDKEPYFLKRSKWQLDSFYDMIPLQIEDPDCLSGAVEDPSMKCNDRISIMHRQEDDLPLYILSELLPGTPDAADIEVKSNVVIRGLIIINEVEKARRDSILKQVHLAIAPDGKIPNSTLNRQLQEWGDSHPGQTLPLSLTDCVTLLVARVKQSKVKKPVIAEVTDTAEKKKEAFKAKLQEMLKKKKEVEEEERLADEKVKAELKALEDKNESGQGSNEELREASHVPLAKPVKPIIATPTPKGTPKQNLYPKIIEFGFQYSWFPYDETEEALKAEGAAVNAARVKAKAEMKAQLLSPSQAPTTPTSTGRQRSVMGNALELPPPQATQSPILELRNNIMSWLRKSLRKYLIRTAKDDETLQKLLESNESGLMDRNKASIDEKEKEDKAMCALREADMKTQAKAKVQQVSKPPPAPKNHGKRERSSISNDAKLKNVIIPGVRHGRRLSIAIEQSNPNAAQKRSASASSLEILSSRTQEHPNNPTTIALTRNAMTTLQTPTVLDFITVINLFCVSLDRKKKREERENLERIAREIRIAEENRLEKEKMEAMAEFLRIKEAERAVRAQLKKEKARQRELERQAAAEAEALAIAQKPKKVTKGFTGMTHVSKCHPSRETLECNLNCIERHNHSLGATMLSNHFRKLNKSMPMDKTELTPFDYVPSTSALALPPLKPPRTLKSRQSAQKMRSRSENRAAKLNDLVTTSQDLGYIRGNETPSLWTSVGQKISEFNASFTATRKYFIPLLSAPEPEDIDDTLEKHSGQKQRKK
ncbi:WD repeat-containing protein 87 [Entophlyctis luteolus]|nr:WD repeat-containing protein 87 [Entophlyctis luteolus]